MKPMPPNEALKYARLAEMMMSDPDFTGNTLLLALAGNLVLRTSNPRGDEFWKQVQKITGWSNYELKRAIRDDAPGYKADSSDADTCRQPMIRREGPCGKPAVHTRLDFRDPDTGAIAVRGACSRHWPDLNSQHRANRADWLAAGSPKPQANSGGMLPKYFKSDWTALYKSVGAHIEGDVLPAVQHRPTLSIVADEMPELSAPIRPRLTVVKGS